MLGGLTFVVRTDKMIVDEEIICAFNLKGMVEPDEIYPSTHKNHKKSPLVTGYDHRSSEIRGLIRKELEKSLQTEDGRTKFFTFDNYKRALSGTIDYGVWIEIVSHEKYVWIKNN